MVDRGRGTRHLGSAPISLRELDLRCRGQGGGRAQRRCAGRPGEDRPVHDDGAMRRVGCDPPGRSLHRRRRPSRPAPGVLRHHRRGHRWHAAHRGLWLGDRRSVRRPHLRDGPPGHCHGRRGRRLVPGRAGRHAPGSRVREHVYPSAGAPDGMSDGAVGEGRSGMEASAGEGGSGSDDPILEVRGIAMRFGRVVALEEATFAARAGQVTCLLGDNGAGKSTVIKVLAGVHAPTTGEYRVDGEPVRFSSPREAMAAGIATVYQDLAVIPLMSVWRNFYLGSEPVLGRGPLRRIDVRTCRTQALNELEAMGIELSDADQPVGSLSGGERQAVAIARALHFGARVLLLDEPTAALGVRQSNLVLDKIRRAAERGVAVILVTHNPHHAHPIGDRFVVLRQGSVIAKGTRDDLTVDSLARLMSGEAT